MGFGKQSLVIISHMVALIGQDFPQSQFRFFGFVMEIVDEWKTLKSLWCMMMVVVGVVHDDGGGGGGGDA